MGAGTKRAMMMAISSRQIWCQQHWPESLSSCLRDLILISSDDLDIVQGLVKTDNVVFIRKLEKFELWTKTWCLSLMVIFGGF